MEEMKTDKWAPLVFAVCLLMHICSAQDGSTTNLNCEFLQKTFPNCPCRAFNTVDAIVDCSNKGLTQVPTIEEQYSKTIFKLDLSNNSITDLTRDSFQGLKVKNLDLKGNKLKLVHNDTFNSMGNTLYTLTIGGDHTNLPPIHALKNLLVIEHLTLGAYKVPILERNQSFFLSFTNLKSLTLDDWKIIHIEGSAFLGLHNLQSLSIINQPELENLPINALRDDPFLQLETLRISYTKINRVSDSVFAKLDSLKNLDLSYNQINQLEPNCFLKVEDTLEIINFTRNILNNQVYEQHIRIAGLAGMSALKSLDLSDNTFKTIPKLPNLGANQPISLILNANEIQNVPSNAFDGYAQQVKDLYLDRNLIRGMHQDSFEGVTQLNSLYVNNQQGADSSPLILPLSLINSASSLHTLSLEGQKVDATSLWNVVKESVSLQTLLLSSTELSSIPDFVFEKVTMLKTLDLSHNRLSEITQKSLAGLRQLKRLDLEGNFLIQTFPACLFHQFQSFPITMSLGLIGIKCDCKIKKLLEDIKSKRIILDSTKDPPKCALDSQPLTMKDPNNLVCVPPFQEPPCENFYTTTPAPTSQVPVTRPEPVLTVNINEVGIHTLKASWSLTDKRDLKKFKFAVQVTSSGVEEFTRDNLVPSQSSMQATGLDANTHVSVCVTAFFYTQMNLHKCALNKTLSKDPIKEGSNDNGSASTNTAIIVGCIVAGVGLIGIVIAVIVLLVFRKKPKKVPDTYAAPTQPRNFAKAELPSMTDDSRTFTKKPKANGKNGHSEGMQVVAISDGQTSPGPRVGRVNMMFQPEDGYEPMSNFKKGIRGSASYENDHGALPPTPGQDSIPPSYPGTSYYNEGFREDKYDEIEVAI